MIDHYEVTVDREKHPGSVVVSGLGVLHFGGNPWNISTDQAQWFSNQTGLPLNQDNVPDGVDVTIVLKDEEDN
jgi:hypothetical protein